jgi:hypothetical protein
MRLLSVSGSPKLNNPHAVIYPQTLLECCSSFIAIYFISFFAFEKIASFRFPLVYHGKPETSVQVRKGQLPRISEATSIGYELRSYRMDVVVHDKKTGLFICSSG